MADDDATRMRLVELRSNNGFLRNVRFAPRLTVVSGFGPPARVGAWIAAALTGPRPEGVEGTIEVAGRSLALDDLPATLLPPQSSIVLTDRDLDDARRSIVEPRYRRVVQRRESAAAERAREEIGRNAAASRFATLEHRLAEIEPALAETLQRAAADEQRSETIATLQGLLAEVDEAAIAAREPDPDALRVAQEWETIQSQRAELARAQPRLSLDDAERRVEVAERALEHARRTRATAADIARLSSLQRAVSDASADGTDRDAIHELEYAGQAGAHEHSDARDVALAAERDALAQLGHTHSSFLISVVAPGTPADDIRQIEAHLAAMRTELRQAQTVASLPTWPEIAQAQLDLRGKAAGVLGHFPGEDVAGELRAFRPGAPALAQARAQLEAGLTAAAIDTTGDVEAAANRWLDEQQRNPPADHTGRLEELRAEREAVESDLRSQAAELVAIAARLRDLDRRLADLSMQESRLATELATDLERCASEDIERALHDVLDEFVSGRRVPGRLPIVVAGAGSAFGAQTRQPTLRELERASERLQVVVIVDDPEVEAWAGTLGPGASVWSPAVAARLEAEERARRDAEAQARRDAEERAVREAEERARRAAEERARREEEERARTVRELPLAPRADVVDLAGADLGHPAGADLRTAPDAERGADREAGTATADDEIQVHIATSARVAPVPDNYVPPPPTPEQPVEARVIDATETIDAREAGEAAAGEGDEWWVPIVARPGASRATRPVGEDLTQRRRRAEQLLADATSLTAHCDVHRNIETTLHCARCRLPFCEQCLALVGEPPALHCVDCALELSGVRSGRHDEHE
jgi:hypothetical protein